MSANLLKFLLRSPYFDENPLHIFLTSRIFVRRSLRFSYIVSQQERIMAFSCSILYMDKQGEW